VNIDGLRSARQCGQKSHYVFLGHARRQALLRPIENVLIFKKQSRRHQGDKPPFSNERENAIARAWSCPYQTGQAAD
jgi:hypothetical protein